MQTSQPPHAKPTLDDQQVVQLFAALEESRPDPVGELHFGRECGGRGRAAVAHVVDEVEALRREDPKVDTEVTLLQIHVDT